ncbi:UAA transporter, partial [Coelomomyces lativittatus]
MNKSSSSSVTSLVFVTTQKFQWNFVSWISSLLDHRYVWLFLYFLCNLVLTLHNKFLMSLYHFSLPYSLTGIHALFAFLGCGVCHWCQLFPVTRFSYHEYKWIGAFSILYTLNIALSNASLHLVSVP